MLHIAFLRPEHCCSVSFHILCCLVGLVTSFGGNHHADNVTLCSCVCPWLGRWLSGPWCVGTAQGIWSCNQREGCSVAGDELHGMEIRNIPNPPPVRHGSTLRMLRLVKSNGSIRGLVL